MEEVDGLSRDDDRSKAREGRVDLIAIGEDERRPRFEKEVSDVR